MQSLSPQPFPILPPKSRMNINGFVDSNNTKNSNMSTLSSSPSPSLSSSSLLPLKYKPLIRQNSIGYVSEDESKQYHSYSLKRDRSTACLSTGDNSDNSNSDSNNEDIQLQKRILLDLQALKLNSNSSSIKAKEQRTLSTTSANVGSDSSSEIETHNPVIFAKNKRNLSRADQLVEDIIRKSRKMSEHVSYNNQQYSMNDMEDLPSCIGPHPNTDMRISTYWSPEKLALVVPSTTNPTIDYHPSFSSFVHRLHRSGIRSYHEDDESEDDSRRTHRSHQSRPNNQGMKSNRILQNEKMSDIEIENGHQHDKPRLEGNNTHVGIIEEVSDISSSVSDDMMFMYEGDGDSLRGVVRQDAIDCLNMDIDAIGIDGSRISTSSNNNSNSNSSSGNNRKGDEGDSISSGEDNENVIDILTIS